MSSTASAREVRALVLELRQAVADLVDPIGRKVLRDDGTATAHVAPSLLDQLQDAVGNSGGRGGVARRDVPMPISAAARDLLTAVTFGAADMHYKAIRRDCPDLADQVRATAAIAGRWTDWQAIIRVVEQLHAWAHEIRELLDPPRRMHVAAPCPACSERMVWREAAGDVVQVPALQLLDDLECVCLACGHRWPPSKLGHLKLSMAVMGTDKPRPPLRSSAEGNGGRWTETRGNQTGNGGGSDRG